MTTHQRKILFVANSTPPRNARIQRKRTQNLEVKRENTKERKSSYSYNSNNSGVINLISGGCHKRNVNSDKFLQGEQPPRCRMYAFSGKNTRVEVKRENTKERKSSYSYNSNDSGVINLFSGGCHKRNADLDKFLQAEQPPPNSFPVTYTPEQDSICCEFNFSTPPRNARIQRKEPKSWKSKGRTQKKGNLLILIRNNSGVINLFSGGCHKRNADSDKILQAEQPPRCR
ncbi:hypothetical protein CDAR_414851 [Caerostris darwini]|uniref:Uncharacterized protein n=1 Tax=Caerostris darwini TaxID=1538125 RepID=A0AAV4RAT3_9ARAC|nr:hypothetical protein CDAR_414851 [Caerostris darwini]